MGKNNSLEMIDFVKKTTEAIITISESTKQSVKLSEDIKDMINIQNTNNARSFEQVSGKIDGLLTMFKYVIIPLVAGILSLVGVKYILKL